MSIKAGYDNGSGSCAPLYCYNMRCIDTDCRTMRHLFVLLAWHVILFELDRTCIIHFEHLVAVIGCIGGCICRDTGHSRSQDTRVTVRSHSCQTSTEQHATT